MLITGLVLTLSSALVTLDASGTNFWVGRVKLRVIEWMLIDDRV